MKIKKQKIFSITLYLFGLCLLLYPLLSFSCISPPAADPDPEPPVVEKKIEVEKPVIEKPERVQVFEEKVVFFDDFSDSKNGWKVGQDDFAVRSIQKGYYLFENTHTQNAAFACIPINLMDTNFFTIESSIKKVGGKGECSYGITWGFNPDTKSSYFLLLFEDYILYGKQEKGEWSNIINWKSYSFIKNGNSTNKIALKKHNENLEVFVNEQPVYVTKAYTLFGDTIGFILFGDIMVKADFILITTCQTTTIVADQCVSDNGFLSTPGHEYLFVNKEQIPAASSLLPD